MGQGFRRGGRSEWSRTEMPQGHSLRTSYEAGCWQGGGGGKFPCKGVRSEWLGSKEWEVGGGDESFRIFIEDENSFYSCKSPWKYSLMGIGKGLCFSIRLSKRPGWEPFGGFLRQESCGRSTRAPSPHQCYSNRHRGWGLRAPAPVTPQQGCEGAS